MEKFQATPTKPPGGSFQNFQQAPPWSLYWSSLPLGLWCLKFPVVLNSDHYLQLFLARRSKMYLLVRL